MRPFRTRFGLTDPPAGTSISIRHMEGLKYYIIWTDCPDLENILYGYFATKDKALKHASSFGWYSHKLHSPNKLTLF